MEGEDLNACTGSSRWYDLSDVDGGIKTCSDVHAEVHVSHLVVASQRIDLHLGKCAAVAKVVESVARVGLEAVADVGGAVKAGSRQANTVKEGGLPRQMARYTAR